MTAQDLARKIMADAIHRVNQLGFTVLHPAGGVLYEVDLPIYAESMVFEPFAVKKFPDGNDA